MEHTQFLTIEAQQAYWEHRALTQRALTVGHSSDTATQHDKVTHEWEHTLRPYIATYFSQNPKLPLLDYGCGVGRFTGLLKNPIGIDPTESLLAIAKQAHPGIVFHTMHVPPRIPLDSESVEGVLCVTVLQHLTAPHLLERSILEISRVLARHGHIILVENTSRFPNQQHIHFRAKSDYTAAFKECKVLLHPMDKLYDSQGEEHTVFVGVKR